jgi:CubicO group peptidase (beta-lactamase class C family)
MIKALVFYFLFGSLTAIAQTNNNAEKATILKNEILQMDSLLFDIAFNQCDTVLFKKLIADDIEFYDDRTGLNNSKQVEINSLIEKCNRPEKLTRRLNTSTVDKLGDFGAVQLGEHTFFVNDMPVGSAKFIHIWERKGKDWIVKRIVSYTHGAVNKLYNDPNIPGKATNKILFEDKEITEKWLAEKHIPALGIGYIKDGKMAQISVFGNLEKGKPAPKNTIWNVASLTKPITANVTLRLVSEGKWDLDEPLYKYWTDPDIANDPRHKLLTTRHILSHQTGFPNWRWNNKSKKLAFDFDPGTKYKYSGEGLEYLRKALEKKFNKTLDQLANELIFKPLNMTDTKFFWDATVDSTRFAKWHNDKGGLYETYKNTRANGADDVLTTIEDYGHFLISIMNSEGLSKPVFDDMVKHQVKTKNSKYFGLGFEIYDLGQGEYALSHGGSDKGVQTIVFIFPKTKQGLIVFTNVDDGHKVYETLLKHYLGDNGKRIFEIETK